MPGRRRQDRRRVHKLNAPIACNGCKQTHAFGLKAAEQMHVSSGIKILSIFDFTCVRFWCSIQFFIAFIERHGTQIYLFFNSIGVHSSDARHNDRHFERTWNWKISKTENRNPGIGRLCGLLGMSGCARVVSRTNGSRRSHWFHLAIKKTTTWSIHVCAMSFVGADIFNISRFDV